MKRVALLAVLGSLGCSDWASLGRNLQRGDLSISDGGSGVHLVQTTYSSAIGLRTMAVASLPSPPAAGDLIVVIIGWKDAGEISLVVDSNGNDYPAAVPTDHITDQSQAMYYALNASAAVGADTVQIQFDRAITYPDLRVLEYAGLDRAGPLASGASATGTGPVSTSGAVDAAAGDLLVGGGTTSDQFSDAGSGWTRRILTQPGGDLAEDLVTTMPGPFRATGATSGDWVMQVAAFRHAL
jgi:hypothetical protein